MKKQLFTGLALGLVALSAVGCSTQGETSPETPVATALSAEAVQAYGNFSAALFHQALKTEDENPVISPTSAWLLLAMAQNGAVGDTHEAFLQVMGLKDEALNAHCQAVTQALESPGGNTVLNLANSIWLDEGYEARPAYLKGAEQSFGAEIFTEKLSTSKDKINGWVSEKTEGMIPVLFDQEPDEGMRMLLLNTLYMKADWAVPFVSENTKDDVFRLPDGTEATTPFMYGAEQSLSYFNENGAEGVLLPYDDGQHAFVVIRPTDGKNSREFGLDLDAQRLKGLLEGAQTHQVNLSMPKFTKEYSFDMKPALVAMGLAAAFDQGKADFSNITEANDLYIGDAWQKVKIDVNEKGTEAAAVSAAAMMTKAMPPTEEIINMKLDTPFIYSVVSLEAQTPLFMGLFSRP